MKIVASCGLMGVAALASLLAVQLLGGESLHTSREVIEDLQNQIEELKSLIESPLISERHSEHRSGDRYLSTLSPGFTYASDYGAIGDSATDDTAAIQAALDAAEATTHSAGGTGGTVILGPGTFYTTAPLRIPGGVTLKGQGYGSSPLAIKFDSGGSTLAYCGDDYAVKLVGHGAALENAAVYDYPYANGPLGSQCETLKAAGGILVSADNELIESVRVKNVLIYWFMGGTALRIQATNEGGAPFGMYEEIRIRHANAGIHITADDTSFTNSNRFNNCVIWGTVHQFGIKAEGPGANNDNQFDGFIVEPSETEEGHIVVSGHKTNVRIQGIRLEGTSMANPSDGSAGPRPIVVVGDDSYGNVMNGVLGHTHVQADYLRNPGIDLMSAKSVGIDPTPGLNQFDNAPFHGFDNDSMEGWSLPGSNRIITKLPSSENMFPNHVVLSIDYLNWGGPFKLSPTSPPKGHYAHSSCTFGIYARSSVQGSIVATMKYESGSMISSSPHSGSGEWEFIGMSALMDTNGPWPTFYITGDVDVTTPTFAYGSMPAQPGASLISASGSVMSGTLTSGMVTVYPPAEGENPYYWTLPKEGNYFEIDVGTNPSRTIMRINHSGSDRMKKGTVVTLLFTQAGTRVKDSGYIKLKNDSDFVSVINSSLTLVSTGGPSWMEVSRNN